MSLINDALKTAQRERNEQLSTPSDRRALEGFFPYSQTADRVNRSRLLAIVGSLAIIIAAAAIGYARARGKTLVPPKVQQRVATAPPAAQAPIVKATATQPLVTPPKDTHQVVSTRTATPEPRVAGTRAPAAAVPHASPTGPVKRVAADTAVAKPTAKPTVPPPPSRQAAAPASHAAPESRAPAARQTVDSTVRSAPSSPVVTEAPGRLRVSVDNPVPKVVDQLFADAYAAQQANQLDRAQQLYEQAIATKQATADVYNNYGALLFRRGNTNGALAMYRMAVRLEPALVQAWINMGLAYEQSGIHAEATGAFMRALQLDPSNIQVKISLANQYVALGSVSDARRLLEEVVRSAPKEPMAHYAYALFLEDQHETAAAVREWDLFIQLGSTMFSLATMDSVRAHVAPLRGRPQ